MSKDVSGPRKARRLNHNFQDLHRHTDPSWDNDEWIDSVDDNIVGTVSGNNATIAEEGTNPIGATDNDGDDHDKARRTNSERSSGGKDASVVAAIAADVQR